VRAVRGNDGLPQPKQEGTECLLNVESYTKKCLSNNRQKHGMGTARSLHVVRNGLTPERSITKKMHKNIKFLT
jgi:hypothetical protein